MQNRFGEQVSWEELADYAEYLSAQCKTVEEQKYSGRERKEFLNLVMDSLNTTRKQELDSSFKGDNLVQIYKKGLRDRFEKNSTRLQSQLASLVPNEEKEKLKEKAL